MFRHSLCQLQAFWEKERVLRPSFINVGILEKAERKLHPQDPANRFVDLRLRHRPGIHQLRHVIVVQTARHVHVHAGKKSLARGRCVIGGNSVCH